MPTIIATFFEIADIHKNVSTYPLIIHSKYRLYSENMSVTVSFILNRITRVITTDNQFDVIDAQFKSAMITCVPQKGLSQADVRNTLYDMGVTRHEIQNIAMKKVQDCIQGLVNEHLSLSGQSEEGLKVDLFLTINRVCVYHGQPVDTVQVVGTVLVVDEDEDVDIDEDLDLDEEQRPKPADDSTIRKLKRKRVDETMIGKDENCSVCMEMLVEREELMALPCEHVFHERCVSKWFKESNVCPLCRFELPAAHTTLVD